jgi:hypothetical protein
MHTPSPTAHISNRCGLRLRSRLRIKQAELRHTCILLHQLHTHQTGVGWGWGRGYVSNRPNKGIHAYSFTNCTHITHTYSLAAHTSIRCGVRLRLPLQTGRIKVYMHTHSLAAHTSNRCGITLSTCICEQHTLYTYIGLARTVYIRIYTPYIRWFPSQKHCTPYIYGSGQPYTYTLDIAVQGN